MSDILVEVKNLTTSFRTPDGVIDVLDNVSFNIKTGKVLGLVGESGCGKSITSLSILRLVPKPNGFIKNGEIIFDNQDLIKLPMNKMESLRGNDISMIFQEPMTALNPVFTIGFQLGEALKIHENLRGKKNKMKCIELLKMVGLPRPEEIIDAYPHQLSGGMRQRVMIAIALSCEPRFLIADEPTTALDVTIQAQILDLMKNLKNKLNTSLLFITHDLGVIAEIADDVAVMYLGKIVEETSVGRIFDNPKHPYTRGLLDSRPGSKKKSEKLNCIPGMVPTLNNKPIGCSFEPRCIHSMDICKEKNPELIEIEPDHKIRCWMYSKEVE